jgi:hypothetical protein
LGSAGLGRRRSSLDPTGAILEPLRSLAALPLGTESRAPTLAVGESDPYAFSVGRPGPRTSNPEDVPAHLTVWRRGATDVIALTEQRITVGRSPSNDVALVWDSKVSHVHAVLERLAPGWTVRDVGSRNGTFHNGERIFTERVIRPGDELRLGDTRLLLSVAGPAVDPTTTQFGPRPPQLTEREKAVLVALCRPVRSANMLTEPATVAHIAEELVVSVSVVKKHLLRLYQKFDIYEEGHGRRGALANEAIRRGAVNLADLRAAAEQGR